jgi:hypothetical protein
VVSQQPHSPALLRACRVGTQLVGASHSQLSRDSARMRTVNSHPGTRQQSRRRSRFPYQLEPAIPSGGT